MDCHIEGASLTPDKQGGGFRGRRLCAYWFTGLFSHAAQVVHADLYGNMITTNSPALFAATY